MIEFSCECGRVLRAEEGNVGRRSTCPACGRSVIVPDQDLPLTTPLPPVAVAPPPAPVEVHATPEPTTPVVASTAEPASTPTRPAPGKDLLEKARPGFRQALQYVQDTARFYSQNASAFWRRFSTSAIDPREIELLIEETYKSASFDETGWTVKLPACCVVCGQPTDNAETEQTASVEDLTQPLWFPVGFAVAGLLLSWWFWTIWPLVVLGLAGFLAGYRMRRQIEVRATCRRCEEHAQVRAVPRFRLVGENLYVGVGHKKVVELFAKKNTPEKVRPGPTASVPEPSLGGGWDSPPPRPNVPTSMPLDDGPAPVPESMPLDDGPLPIAPAVKTAVPSGPLNPKVKEVIRASVDKLWSVLHEKKSTAPCDDCGFPFLATDPARARTVFKLVRLVNSHDPAVRTPAQLGTANLGEYLRVPMPPPTEGTSTEDVAAFLSTWGLVHCPDCSKRLCYRCRGEAADRGCSRCPSTVAGREGSPDLRALGLERLNLAQDESAEALNEQLDVLWDDLRCQPEPCAGCGLRILAAKNQKSAESSIFLRATNDASWMPPFALLMDQTARYLKTTAPRYAPGRVRNAVDLIKSFHGLLAHLVLEKCPRCKKLVCRRCAQQTSPGCAACAPALPPAAVNE